MPRGTVRMCVIWMWVFVIFAPSGTLSWFSVGSGGDKTNDNDHGASGSHGTDHTNGTSSPPQLEVTFLSPTKGYVQTPGWDGTTVYRTGMDSTVTVNVTEDHAVMLSFHSVDLPPCTLSSRFQEAVSVYTGRPPERQLLWTVCSKRRTIPAVVLTEAVHVHFYSAQHRTSPTGFRLLFSFHNVSAVPERLPDGKWNCSVPHWADFQQHFAPDLVLDCAGGEDEPTYPGTGDICGAGFTWAGDSCFQYVQPTTPTSWSLASAVCKRRGGLLASLNTPREWTGFMNLVQRHSRQHFEENIKVYVGLKSTSPVYPRMYQGTMTWSDGTIAYFTSMYGIWISAGCFSLTNIEPYGITFPDSPSSAGSMFGVRVQSPYRLSGVGCRSNDTFAHFMCEMTPQTTSDETLQVELPTPFNTSRKYPKLSSLDTKEGADSADAKTRPGTKKTSDTSHFSSSHVICPAGHVTYAFLACDVKNACWGKGYGASYSCDAPLTPLPPSFTCANGIQRVPYTLVCDFRSDCRDRSDEQFCAYLECEYLGGFKCGNKQCVKRTMKCDGLEQCVNGADEKRCIAEDTELSPQIPPPARIDFDGRGKFTMAHLVRDKGLVCPDTHFMCPTLQYCLPVHVRCNRVRDCPGGEDEKDCGRYTCPGFYRCRDSRICVHPHFICDGVAQCPQFDDELLCDLTCPASCTCYGLAFICTTWSFPAASFPNLRYIDASGTDMRPEDFEHNRMLIHLRLARCGLTHFPSVELPNLHTLDISGNLVTGIGVDALRRVPNLRVLSVAGNPAIAFPGEMDRTGALPKVIALDVSRIPMHNFNISVLKGFQNVRILNMSGNGVVTVSGEGFQPMRDLRVLDIRRCPMTEFPRRVFDGLHNLKQVYADTFKLCCSRVLPAGFNPENCQAPKDLISSCDSLLGSNVHRVFLSVFAAMALVGNFVSFVYREFLHKGTSSQSFGLLVSHLSLTDFLMGVNLAAIGITDRLYQGKYLWKDLAWRNSAACKAVGVLSFLSSEVSAAMMCLLTLDRLFALYFPSTQQYVKKGSVHTVCAAVWFAGFLLSVIPLLPVTSHWEFYSQTGLCVPIPLTNTSFAGYGYFFGVVVVVEFVTAVFVGIGQCFIYRFVSVNTQPFSKPTQASVECALARRIFLTAFLHFFPRFLIGVLSFLKSNGTSLVDELGLAAALIYPLNSALNPFLYGLGVHRGRKRQAEAERLSKVLASQLKSANVSSRHRRAERLRSLSGAQAWSLFLTWLDSGVLTLGRVESILTDFESKKQM